MGVDIPRITLADWCGRAMRTLQPLIERIETSVLASDVIHADDTPIRVLDHARRAKGLGKGVKQGRIWGYVCRSEENTSELQPLMRISYAVFCLKKKNKQEIRTTT